MHVASFGFDSGYPLLHNNPPTNLGTWKRTTIFYLILKISGVSGKGPCTRQSAAVAWPEAGRSFPRWLIYMALTRVGGKLSWGQGPSTLFPFHVGLLVGYMNFLTEWWLSSKWECPKSQEVEAANFLKAWVWKQALQVFWSIHWSISYRAQIWGEENWPHLWMEEYFK